VENSGGTQVGLLTKPTEPASKAARQAGGYLQGEGSWPGPWG